MRVALYARYSTQKQDELSIEAQLEHCRAELLKRGWVETHCFTDAAISGATLHRPGIQALIAATNAGNIDIVYADAMDRLSRSQADIAMLFERLKFRGIRLVTRGEGEISPMHIGIKGTMNAEQLAVTAIKTRDALRHRFQAGKNPGGIAYGYEIRIEHDANGDRIKGLVQIVPAEARTIVRIMEEYAAGRSPDSIAKQLNRERVPPPRSGKRDKQRTSVVLKPPMWAANTISGNAERATGILNNIRYIGQRPFEKQQFRKNPESGKRHAFVNPPELQQAPLSVPELRIVSDELWSAVKARQTSLRTPVAESNVRAEVA